MEPRGQFPEPEMQEIGKPPNGDERPITYSNPEMVFLLIAIDLVVIAVGVFVLYWIVWH